MTSISPSAGLMKASYLIRASWPDLRFEFEEVEIFFDGLGHRERARPSDSRVRPRHHQLASFLLRLPVVQNLDAIGIREIVGGANALGRVSLISDVVTRPPRSRAPLESPIAKVQALLDAAPVGFSTGCEPASRIAGIQCLSLTLRATAVTPHVQRMSNIRGWAAINKDKRVCTGSYDNIGTSGTSENSCGWGWTQLHFFHGGNRGSNPLGRASFPLFIPAMRSCRAFHALFNIQITGRMIP